MKNKHPLSRYLATGVLAALIFYLFIQLYIFVTNDTALFFLVTWNSKSGDLPVNGVNGGWTRGPLYFLVVLLGAGFGWIVYKIRTHIRN